MVATSTSTANSCRAPCYEGLGEGVRDNLQSVDLKLHS